MGPLMLDLPLANRSGANISVPAATPATPHGAPPQTPAEIGRWRAQQRRALRARLATGSPGQLADAVERISATLRPVIDAALAAHPGRPLVGWRASTPGEPDLSALLQSVHARGAPVQIAASARGQPQLRFLPWAAAADSHGSADVVPIFGARAPSGAAPAVVLAPMPGWDAAGHRLGRGQGTYDRTLSRLPAETVLIGIGLDCAGSETIHPQPFDVRMDLVITESGVVARAPASV